jgi:hypothetical protein
MPRTYPGKLNLFQRMMLRWRDLHPYNAVHAAHVARAFDAAATQAAIAATLQDLGLTGFALDPARRRFVYRGGPAQPELAVRHAAGDADVALGAEIARQLNEPFAADAPLRFFAVVDGDNGFHLGLVYDHFIAGGDSAAMLLGALVARLDEGGFAPVPPPVYPATYAKLVRQHPGWFAEALGAVPALARESKRVYRCAERVPEETRNAFALMRFGADATAALRARAARLRITLHDLVVALLLRTLSPLAEARRREPRRHDLGVASIVNVRRAFGADEERSFGQFLASIRIAHPVPDGIALDDLARDVGAITRPLRRSHLSLRTLYGLVVAACAWPFLSRGQRLRFYAKHHPAWAGVSMLDVDPLWPAPLGIASRYTRGVSTGPVTPAVLAISTTAQAMSIGVSWRTTALPAEFPSRLQSVIEECVQTSG